MVLPFLSFLRILFLVLQGSICLPSVLTTMATFFQKPYVFPPIILIPQVLRFVKGQFFPCTIVVPRILLVSLMTMDSYLITFGERL